MKLKSALYGSLFFAYLGEYASLISLLEYSKQFGGADRPVILYVVYSLPALLLLLISTVWKNQFSRTTRSFPYVLALGAGFILSITQAHTFATLLIGILILALFKQWAKILTLTTIRQNFSGEERSTLLSSVITLRFVVMILGATIGGFLSEHKMFSTTLIIHAICYSLAAVTLYCTRRNLSRSPEAIASDFTQVVIPKPFAAFRDLKANMGMTFLMLISLGCLTAGGFFALEYPILTMDLRIAPSLLSITYLGHVFGALLAQRASVKINKNHFSFFFFAGLTLLLILSYFFVGIGFESLIWYSLQLGICAFLLPLFEIYYSESLMSRVPKEKYPFAAVALNIISESSSVIGSMLTLPLIMQMAPIQANRSMAIVYAIILAVLVSYQTRRIKVWRVIVPLFLVIVLGLTDVVKSSQVNKWSANQLVLHQNLTDFYQETFAKIDVLIESSANILEKQFRLHDCKIPPQRESPKSSFYVPLSAKNNNDLKCFELASQGFETLWDQSLNEMPYLSWIYSYDSSSQALRISPPTDTVTLFGKNMNFDSFSFNQRAQANPFQTVWADSAKEDINGTGLILIGSRTVKVRAQSPQPVVSVDLNVKRVLKSQSKEFLKFHDDNNIKDFFVFLYSKVGNNRFTAGDWATDSNQWATIKSFKGEILSVLESENRALLELEKRSTGNSEPVSDWVSLRDSKYFCSVSEITRSNIFIWICAN